MNFSTRYAGGRSPNVKGAVESVSKAYEVIKILCTTESCGHTGNHTNPILFQARRYLDVLEDSLEAAEQGCVFCSDVKALYDIHRAGPLVKTIPEPLSPFLADVYKMASDAHDSSEIVSRAFGDVNEELLNLASQLAGRTGSRSTTRAADIAGNAENVHVLAFHAAHLAEWWEDTRVDLHRLRASVPEISGRDYPREVIPRKQWETVRLDFQAYKDGITEIQDYFDHDISSLYTIAVHVDPSSDGSSPGLYSSDSDQSHFWSSAASDSQETLLTSDNSPTDRADRRLSSSSTVTCAGSTEGWDTSKTDSKQTDDVPLSPLIEEAPSAPSVSGDSEPPVQQVPILSISSSPPSELASSVGDDEVRPSARRKVHKVGHTGRHRKDRSPAVLA